MNSHNAKHTHVTHARNCWPAKRAQFLVYIYMIMLERNTATQKSAFLDNRLQSLDIFNVKILPFKKCFGRFW